MREANDKNFVGSQYRDPGNLGVRQRFHQLYSENKEGWSSWVFRNLELPESGSVLELGCGNGSLWLENMERVSPSLQVTLTDVSTGLLDNAKQDLESHASNFKFDVVDATRITYDAASFDAVIANHMLYHLGDLDGALSGIRQVLKPAGSFYASTVGADNMRELQDFVTRSGWKVDLDLASPAKAFGLENGEEILRRHFGQVDVVRYKDALVVPSADAVVEYLSSLFPAQTVPENLRKALQDEVNDKGAIHITKSVGMFRCKEPRR